MNEKYEDLLKMRDTLNQKLAKASDATSDTWESTKDRLEDYADTLETKIDQAIN